ncbi:MAG: NfeD family protein [Ignavibacteria bacterium]|nr:NfeD family protein [Ignavibacteria bacterium]MBP6510773.1 NfeD family protein [Candidatus Kapabacteria bacterium]MBK6420560.1 NfeD family protein [Ignavibacteria bacterium]MBK6761482.1 NfeD family protein [Ignavibacteria bacterium]MBK7033507.1 NfeD family protein [Ignavibacteria bacterium]
MTPAQYWLAAAIILFILEIVTPGFVLANVAVACMAASAAAWFGASVTIQVIVFIVAGLVSLVTIRPLLHKTFMKGAKHHATGAHALIGRIVRVTDEISVPSVEGRVQVDGDSWRAISIDHATISAGDSVRIVRVDSTILYVEHVK